MERGGKEGGVEEGRMEEVGREAWYYTLEVSLCEMGLIRGSK